jgi:hypothetical protein
MRPLAELQRAFLAGLYDADEPRDRRARIYRRNVLANLHDALAAAYPVVRRLVGEAFFREAAERFALAFPSRSGDLHRFGSEFAEFLEQYAHARDLPYLPDVARLEWACAESFHAADGEGLDALALQALSEDEAGRVRLRLHPAVRLLESSHPIAAIWHANQPGKDGTPARVAGADQVLVHRQDFAVHVRALGPAEWELLRAIERGETLGAMAADPAIAPDLARQLVHWTARRVIDGFSA